MANTIYPTFIDSVFSGDANSDLLTGDVKAVLLDTGTYTYSAAHQYADDLSGVVATSGNLASKTFSGGVFDSADVTWSSVTGSTAEAIAIYIDTGTPATSRLVAYLDTSQTNLPVTPNGGDITYTVGGTNGWFKINPA